MIPLSTPANSRQHSRMADDANNGADRAPAPGLFTTTHWSLVRRAQNDSVAALNSLFQSYRNPLLVWLQARGRSPHDAEDLVHGCLAGLLRRDFLKSVSPESGKFRSFLLASLKNHVHDERDKEGAGKRGGGQVPVSLQESDDQGQLLHDPAAQDATPDLEFDRAWARTVLANSLHRLKAECARTGHNALCAALEPVMFMDETALPYQSIGEQLGMNAGAVRVAALRIRARLRGIVRQEILQTVDSEMDLQAELRYLMGLFGK